jgi:hypothetical protein
MSDELEPAYAEYSLAGIGDGKALFRDISKLRKRVAIVERSDAAALSKAIMSLSADVADLRGELQFERELSDRNDISRGRRHALRRLFKADRPRDVGAWLDRELNEINRPTRAASGQENHR